MKEGFRELTNSEARFKTLNQNLTVAKWLI